MTKLQPFDPTNPDHLTKQLFLVGMLGSHLAKHEQKLSPEADDILSRILFVFDTAGAELTRRITNAKATAEHYLSLTSAVTTAGQLVEAMIASTPELLAYQLDTAPVNLDEAVLSHLSQFLILASRA
jgi:hypothetical protein